MTTLLMARLIGVLLVSEVITMGVIALKFKYRVIVKTLVIK